MRVYGKTTDQILSLLSEQEMTLAEICEQTGQSKQNISALLRRLNVVTPRMPKRIYIVRWVHDAIGARRYPRAVYALGDKPDARKPKSDIKAIRKRYEERLRKKWSGASVFNLGINRDQVRAMRKELNERTQQASGG